MWEDQGQTARYKLWKDVHLGDEGAWYIVSWHPRHKLYNNTAPLTQEGPFEAKTMLDKMEYLVWKGDPWTSEE